MIDSLCLTWVVRRFNAPMRFRDIVPIRASMYLLALINTNLGQGGVAYYLYRKAKIPFLEALSSILFIALMEIYQLFLFSTLGVIFYHPTSPAQIEIVSILRVAYVIAWALLVRDHRAVRDGAPQRRPPRMDCHEPRRSDRRNLPQGASARLCDRARHQGAEFSLLGANAVFRAGAVWDHDPAHQADAVSAAGVSRRCAADRGRASRAPARRRGCCSFQATRRRRKFSPTASPRTSPSCSAMA